MATSTTRRVAAVTGIAALAFAGAFSTSAHAATTLTYDCSALSGGVDAGQWTVEMTLDLPAEVEVGEKTPAPAITSTVTTSTGAADLMRNVLQAKTVEGTGTFGYDIDGEDLTGTVTVPSTDVPATGPIVVDADGTGSAATAPSAPTTSTVTAGDFAADLTVTKADGSTQKVDVTCTLPEGADATLGTIEVVEGTPEPTSSEPTDEPTEDPSEEPTEEPTDAPSGPPVETGVTGDGANGETIALGLMAVGGVAAVTAATRRRLGD